MKLEITVDSVSSVSFARKVLDIPLFVLIRPRSGDFLYTDLEYEVMKRDILHAREAGADRIVAGIFHGDGTVDMERMAELVVLSRPMQITFHRCH